MISTFKLWPLAKLRGAFILIAAAVMMLAPGAGYAQSRPSLPDDNTLARLVWATMIAVDNANRTEDYSVLYALGSPNFQAGNSPAQLSANFQALRLNRVDVGRAILTTPKYYLGPYIDEYGRLRMRGAFEYRPKNIRFDLMYELVDGGWQINAISVVEMDANAPR